MQKERKVHAHLCDCQDGKQYRHRMRVHGRCRRSPERCDRQNDRVRKADEVTPCPMLLARIDSRRLPLRLYLGVHYLAPRYTMVNTPIQTMSRACQNNAKQKKRRPTMG